MFGMARVSLRVSIGMTESWPGNVDGSCPSRQNHERPPLHWQKDERTTSFFRAVRVSAVEGGRCAQGTSGRARWSDPPWLA